MITSSTNAHVKYIRSLGADRRQRHNERCFVLEGVRLVVEALDAQIELRLVLYAPDQLMTTPAGQALLECLAGQPGCFATTPRVVAVATDTVTPQGVVAVAAWPELPRRAGLTLVLDAIQDPGNVGTLLRSAEASGVGCTLCAPGTVDVYSPKVVRAAMGAHFFQPLCVDIGWDAIIATLGDVPRIYATAATASTPYYAVDWRSSSALIIGNEAHGISAAAHALATHTVSIPMIGRTESLNAGVAGSIILFEALRQRSQGVSL